MQRNEPMSNRAKIITAGTISFFVVLILFLLFALPAYNRYQTRQDAANEVKVTHTHIEKAEEEAKVNYAQIKATKAEARKRVVEAEGLKLAQDEVQKTLTPLYVQFEYVKAIEQAAKSDSNTIEFIPVGSDGLPIVGNTPLTPQEKLGGEE